MDSESPSSFLKSCIYIRALWPTHLFFFLQTGCDKHHQSPVNTHSQQVYSCNKNNTKFQLRDKLLYLYRIKYRKNVCVCVYSKKNFQPSVSIFGPSSAPVVSVLTCFLNLSSSFGAVHLSCHIHARFSSLAISQST